MFDGIPPNGQELDVFEGSMTNAGSAAGFAPLASPAVITIQVVTAVTAAQTVWLSYFFTPWSTRR